MIKDTSCLCDEIRLDYLEFTLQPNGVFDMNTKSTALIAAAVIFSSGTVYSATMNIYIDQSTTLDASYNGSEYSGNTSSGRLSVFNVGYTSSFITDGLLGFDLSPIYSGLTSGQSIVINSAALNIAETASSYPYPTTFNVVTSDINADSWNETTVTYDGYYGGGGSITALGSGDSNLGSDNYLSPVNLDLSLNNQAKFFDDEYLSLLLWSSDWTFTSPFEFYGADSTKAPFLTISYEVVNPVPVPGALYMLLSGLVSLSLFARRNKVI